MTIYLIIYAIIGVISLIGMTLIVSPFAEYNQDKPVPEDDGESSSNAM